ncbi:EamA family transporter RarD [Lysinibacillus sp. KU-BSD001]|uniref:EamA family transporter RarD n=1 Tax=Lysinibacillus sp. KU-BSD001 TaxID=3141328 RepID=UPI0036EFC7CC
MTEQHKGMLFAFLSYAIWGIFPLFWKLLEHVNSIEILLGRIIWSFVFTTLFILLIGKRKQLIEDLHYLWQHKRQFFSLMAASFFISINWYVYIWAVTHDRVLESSMGYYINPIISVLFGMLIFKERLSRATMAALCVALLGVLVMTVNYGQVPWVSLLLALSFATYGVLKKRIVLEATRGLAIETLFIMPFALMYYVYLYSNDTMQFLHVGWQTDILMMISGIITAIPLILFAKGAQKIPLYLMGFIQYVSPTITFLLGVFLYKEPFTHVELFAFSCIWTAIIIFSYSSIHEARKRHTLLLK